MAGKKSEREQEVDALLDELLKGQRPEDILNKGGLVEDLTKRLVERALEGEMTDHLGYEKHSPAGRDGGNSRNGKKIFVLAMSFPVATCVAVRSGCAARG